jgi:hypothetical protein
VIEPAPAREPGGRLPEWRLPGRRQGRRWPIAAGTASKYGLPHEPRTVTALYFIVLFVILFMGLPVAFGLGGVAVLFAIIFEPRSLLAVPSAFYSTPWSTILVTVPLFLFMGSLIRYSGHRRGRL